MGKIQKNSITQNIQKYIPITLLFISVLNEFDFNNLGLTYFSFNFSYILIFYYGLKKSESLGYVYIFIAGLFNDVVVGTPIGISSLMFLILCGAAAYLRNITLRPSLIKDSIFFLITILITKRNNQNNKIQNEEIEFLKKNLSYGHKCRKNFINDGYKVGTAEYRKCVLNKGLKQ